MRPTPAVFSEGPFNPMLRTCGWTRIQKSEWHRTGSIHRLSTRWNLDLTWKPTLDLQHMPFEKGKLAHEKSPDDQDHGLNDSIIMS